MLNITTIQTALYDWVFGVIDPIIVRFSHQDFERPNTAYALINIMQSSPQGTASSEYTLLGNDSIDIDYSTLEILLVSINVQYAGAFQTTTKIKDSLARITVTDDLFVAGLGYLKTTGVQRIPEEINKQWEERAQFDCFFATRSLDEENIETIQKIEITNNINDDGETVTIEKPQKQLQQKQLQQKQLQFIMLI